MFLILTPAFVALKAQTGNEVINSGELLEKGTKLHDDGKYKEAIALYKTIPRSDTNYRSALYELSFNSYADSDYDASKRYAELGLKLFPSELPDWYTLLADALDEMNKRDEALLCYDSILKVAPYNYVTWFNKGITMYNLEKFKEAKALFQKTLLINPYYTSAHYFLGKIYLKEGNLPAALFCFTTGLAINPENRYRDKSVTALASIASVKDDVAAAAANAQPTSADNFDLQQEILLGKIALDKQYQLKTEVEDPITRQIQVLIEKVEFSKNDNSFCMQFYVPFYKKIFEEDRFNELVNYMFSGLDIKPVQEYGKKHKKEIEDYKSFATAYFNGIRETQVLNAQDRQAASIHYYVEDGAITGKGAWRETNGNKMFYGPWEFYYNNGQLKSKGVLNDRENKDGEWIFYYRNGMLKEHSTYLDDSLTGKCSFWFDNGNLSSECDYKDNKEEGEKTTYYFNGLVRSIAQYKGGKKNGVAKGYKATGLLSYIATYKDDMQDGPETFYQPNGKIQSESNYAADKADGPYKKYDEDGVLIMQGTYSQDKADGPWKEWYSSSKLKNEYTYQNGNLEGVYTEYFENGRIKSQTTYTKGKQEGKEQFYDEDGKLYCETESENNRLRELKYFDKAGNEISNTTTRHGAGTLTFFDVYGNKTSEGYYNKDGQENGVTTSYFNDGKISSTANYINGELNGDKTVYYHNGVINDKLNYKNGKGDGYYIDWYENNKKSYEGWMVDGDKQGPFYDYNTLGDLTSVIYYKDGDEDGYAEYYYPNGKKDYEELNEVGWLKHITQFDSTGKIMEDVDLPKGSVDFEFKYSNGKPYINASYRNYHLHGRYDAFFPDGSVFYTLFYKQGVKDSIYRQYYYGGQLDREGKYANGEKEGVWKYYYENGKLYYAEEYKHDNLVGKSIFYNDDGTLNRQYYYKGNSLDSEAVYYGDNNKVAMVFNYHDGRLMGYTYEGKDGKLVNEIPLKNQSGAVTAYYKNGTKSAEMTFDNGVVDGLRTLYFSNGKVFTQGQRLWGNYQGEQKKYNVSGQLLSEENYYYDNLHGAAKYYYPDGKVKADENYYNGELNGICKYYDETGKLKQIRFYYFGLLESVQ